MTGANPTTEEDLALYDAIERAIINIHAALAEMDGAWARITASGRVLLQTPLRLLIARKKS